MRYHLTPVRMATINKSTNNSVGEDVERREQPCTVGGITNWNSHCGNSMEVPQNIKNRTIYDSAIPLWGTYPKKYKH